jgi:hypothetical protein
MSTIVVQAFITLDGVVQAGGGPDEDREGGFEYGGWAMDHDRRMDELDEGGKIVESGRAGPRRCCSAARHTRSSPPPGVRGTRTPRASWGS